MRRSYELFEVRIWIEKRRLTGRGGAFDVKNDAITLLAEALPDGDPAGSNSAAVLGDLLESIETLDGQART